MDGTVVQWVLDDLQPWPCLNAVPADGTGVQLVHSLQGSVYGLVATPSATATLALTALGACEYDRLYSSYATRSSWSAALRCGRHFRRSSPPPPKSRMPS